MEGKSLREVILNRPLDFARGDGLSFRVKRSGAEKSIGISFVPSLCRKQIGGCIKRSEHEVFALIVILEFYVHIPHIGQAFLLVQPDPVALQVRPALLNQRKKSAKADYVNLF